MKSMQHEDSPGTPAKVRKNLYSGGSGKRTQIDRGLYPDGQEMEAADQRNVGKGHKPGYLDPAAHAYRAELRGQPPHKS
jgi:hypothetical protein